MEFDKIVKSYFLGIELEYGFFEGNEIILLIKIDQDDNDNKYISLAHELNQKYGFTIIVSSNHFTGPDPLGNAVKVIKNYQKEKCFTNLQIYYMGYSTGGLVGAWYLYKHKEIKKALLINAPIKTNLKMFSNGLEKFTGDRLTLVYGDLDFSYKYIPFIISKLNDKTNLEIVENADHDFKGLEKEFHDLPEKYLFNLNEILSNTSNNK